MKRLSCILSALAVLALVSTVTFAEGEGKKGPKTSHFAGEITKIETTSVTVARKGDSGETSKTYTTNADTKVLLPADAVATAPAKEGKKAATKAGKLEDLKVGDRVSVTADDKDVALSITVATPPAPKTGGEGK